MVSSKGKILIAALSLALLASVMLIYAEQTEMSATTPIDAPQDFKDAAALGGPYSVIDTVNLPALSAGETWTFDGKNTTAVSNFVLSYGGTADIPPYSLISIPNDNYGTYIFQNMTMDSKLAVGVEIGSGSGSVHFNNVIFTGECSEKIQSSSNIVIDSCTFESTGYSPTTYIDIQSGDLTLTNSQLHCGDYGIGVVAETSGLVSIDSCTFDSTSSSGGIYIDIQNGDLTLKDSQLIGGLYMGVVAETSGLISIDSCYFEVYIGVEIETSSPISIDNCYFEVASSGSAIYSYYGAGAVDLAVSNCTFYGTCPPDQNNDVSDINIQPADGSVDNSIKITNSLFTGNYPCNNQAIELGGNGGGNGTGTITIADCYFTDFETVWGPAVSLDTPSMSFSITGTTFYEVTTGDYGQPSGGPILEIMQMNGQITNSTFDGNTIWGSSQTGCVYLNDSQVDMIYDTFYENGSLDSSYNYMPANVEIDGTTAVNLINCIMDPQYDDASTILNDSGITITPYGCITTGDTQNIYLQGVDTFAVCNGPLAGCNINPSVPQAAVLALLILPGGDADGNGVNESDLSGVILQDSTVWPSTDQIGGDRVKSDIGSVATPALFDANGGYWEYGPSYDEYAYPPINCYFLEPSSLTSDQYGQLTAAPENGKTVLPSSAYAVLGNADSTAKFLGWSTNKNAMSPDNITSAGFAADTTYYAVWASPVTVTFNNNGQISSVSVKYGSPVAKPTDPVLSGYGFMGWFTASDGGTQWDFNTNVTANITLYAQWEIIPTITVNFVNGTQMNSVSVPYGETVPKPTDPVLEGRSFDGWFTASEGGTQWDFNTRVTANMTLYAHWSAGSGTTDDNGFTTTDGTVLLAVIVASVISSLGILPMAFASAGLASKLSVINLFGRSTSNQSGQDSTSEDNIVTFDPRNHRSPWATTVSTGRLLSRPGDPKAKGKIFSHWSETPNGPPFDFMRSVTGVLHLFAVYTEEGSGRHEHR